MSQTITHPSTQGERSQDKAKQTPEYAEGRVAKAIEHRTAQMPSDSFLWAAGAAVGGSLLLQLAGRKQDARFVGQWAPTLLCLGIYNKMVKQHGHDDRS